MAVGDIVALNPSHPCGLCKFCRQSAPQHRQSMRFKGSALRFPHEQGMFRDRIVMQAYPLDRVQQAMETAAGRRRPVKVQVTFGSCPVPDGG